MRPPKGPEFPPPPVMAVIAGLEGAGKTTLIEQLLGEDGFPGQLVVDTMDNIDTLNVAMLRAFALNHSIAIETSFQHAGVVQWMIEAKERNFSVELIIVGVESAQLLLERDGRHRDKRKLLEAIRRTSAAVDQARRVMLIDNSTGTPFVAAVIDSGNVKIYDSRPTWVAERILTPRLARMASFNIIKGAYQTVVNNAKVTPILQTAGVGTSTYQGLVIALSEYHVLQQLGNALHVIHDVSLLTTGGVGLALNAVAAILYAQAGPADKDRPNEPEQSQER